MSLILSVSVPVSAPSVNHYWVASGKKRFISQKARDFHKVMALYVKPVASDKRLRAEIVFNFPDRRRRDIDNHLKGVLDSLTKLKLCIDDEQFDELHIKRGEIVKGGLIEIKVWELPLNPR